MKRKIFAGLLTVLLMYSASGFAESTMVGSLPDSNQWVTDRDSAYIYLSYESLKFVNTSPSFGHFTTDLGSSNFSTIGVNSYTRLSSFASPEGTSIFSRFAIWLQMGLGFGERDGSLYDTTLQSELPAESSSILIFSGKAGLHLVYDYATWIKPYVGFSNTWYGYRHSSSMSSANAQGGDSYYGPVAGIHFPLNFIGKAAAYVEVQNTITPNDSAQLFASAVNFNTGLGFSF